MHASLLLLALLLHLQLLRWLAPHFAATGERVQERVLQIRMLPAPVTPAAEAPGPPVEPESHRAATPAPAALSRPAPMPNPTPAEEGAAAQVAAPASFTHSLHALTRQPELQGDGPQLVQLPEDMQQPGSILLRLFIDRHGVVNGVNVLRSTLPREIEGQIVLQFYRAAYRPGEIDGEPVDSEMLLQIATQ